MQESHAVLVVEFTGPSVSDGTSSRTVLRRRFSR